LLLGQWWQRLLLLLLLSQWRKLLLHFQLFTCKTYITSAT